MEVPYSAVKHRAKQFVVEQENRSEIGIGSVRNECQGMVLVWVTVPPTAYAQGVAQGMMAHAPHASHSIELGNHLKVLPCDMVVLPGS